MKANCYVTRLLIERRPTDGGPTREAYTEAVHLYLEEQIENVPHNGSVHLLRQITHKSSQFKELLTAIYTA